MQVTMNHDQEKDLDKCKETNEIVAKKKIFPIFDSLIPMVKESSIIYRNDIPKIRKEYRTALDTAWTEIAAKLNLGKRSCMHHWKNIKFTYAKLKMLCKSGKVSEDDVKLHKNTTRYFDGTLSFLDPHIGGITEANIPLNIHKQIDPIFSFKFPQSCDNNEPKPSPFLTHENIIRAIEKRPKEKEFLDKEDEQRLYNLVENVIKHKLNELFPPITISETPNKAIQLQLHSELIIEEHTIKKEEIEHTTNKDFMKMEIDDDHDESNSTKMPNNEARVEDNNLVSGDVHNNMMITGNQTEISSNVASKISGITIVGGNGNIITEKIPVISSHMTSRVSDIDLIGDVNSMITEEKPAISSIIDVNLVGRDVNTMITEDMITEEKAVISNIMTNRISDIALVGSVVKPMTTEEKPVISNNMTNRVSNNALVGADVNTMITEIKPVISSNMTSSISAINSLGGDVSTMITEDIEEKPIISSNSRISDTNMKKFFAELGEVMSIELPKEKQVLLKGRINTLLRNISEQE